MPGGHPTWQCRLYRISQGGKTMYARDDRHKDELLASEFSGRGKVEIGRFKGLGEMLASQLKETTMDPSQAHAAVGRGRQSDPEGTKSAVDALMGTKPGARFRFIQERAEFAEELDIGGNRLRLQRLRARTRALSRSSSRWIDFRSVELTVDVRGSGLAGRGADLAQHEPAHLLDAGEPLAVGDLAPDLECTQDHLVRVARQAGLVQQCAKRDVAAVCEKRPHPCLPLPAQRDERRAEEIDLAVGDHPTRKPASARREA